MSSTEFTARRALSAVAIAIAAVTGPLMAPVAAVQLMGDPAADCTGQSTPGNNEVSCTPPSVQPTGAPSESDVTIDNDSTGGPGGGSMGGPGGGSMGGPGGGPGR